MLLSICIPTYNRSKYLLKTLKSIEIISNESNLPFEIVIGDNNSKDKTEDVVNSFLDKLPIKYVKRKKNVGTEKNWLLLASEAKGKYIWILCDDDIILDGIFSKLHSVLKKNYSSILLNYSVQVDGSQNFAPSRRINTYDSTGSGYYSYFKNTMFANSFLSSNIWNRKIFMRQKDLIEKHLISPWLQCYVSYYLLLTNENYFVIGERLISQGTSKKRYSDRINVFNAGNWHFYFNTIYDFIDFLDFINWADNSKLSWFKGTIWPQIKIEKETWFMLTHDNDYKYWFNRIILIQKYNKIFSLGERVVFSIMMMVPFKLLFVIDKLIRINSLRKLVKKIFL